MLMGAPALLVGEPPNAGASAGIKTCTEARSQAAELSPSAKPAPTRQCSDATRPLGACLLAATRGTPREYGDMR